MYRIDNTTLTAAPASDVRNSAANRAAGRADPLLPSESEAGPAELVAAAIAVARHRYGPARKFAHDVGQALEGQPLSRQAIYLWESGTNRVPATALIVAARLVGMTVEELLQAASRFSERCPVGGSGTELGVAMRDREPDGATVGVKG